ncbi:MAG: hypothetical protein V4649_18655 [Bacteroidota bacterium]
MKRQPRMHQLQPGEKATITVYAGAIYSPEAIAVQVGEEYHVWCDKGQRWVDMVIPASPRGYRNPLANIFGQRVKGVKCFCLCAAYNGSDSDAFGIGMNKTFVTTQDGTLSFFANDVRGYEWNNWGKIRVNVKRVR